MFKIVRISVNGDGTRQGQLFNDLFFRQKSNVLLFKLIILLILSILNSVFD